MAKEEEEEEEGQGMILGVGNVTALQVEHGLGVGFCLGVHKLWIVRLY